MDIKPESEEQKQSNKEPPKPSPEHPAYVRVKRMAAVTLHQLSRDYVIEHEKLEILSWDYVIKHGKEFGEDLWWDRNYGFYICECSGDDDEEVYYTGLSYEVFEDGKLNYYEYFKNGRPDGVHVTFYRSGKLCSYGFNREGQITGKHYIWYEDGQIHYYRDGGRLFDLDENGYMLQKTDDK